MNDGYALNYQVISLVISNPNEPPYFTGTNPLTDLVLKYNIDFEYILPVTDKETPNSITCND